MLTAYAKATAIHRDYMTTISLFCSTRHISNALRRRWFLFVHEDWRLFRGISTPQILQQFPYHLHSSTLYSMYSGIAKSCPMLTSVDDAMVKFLLHFAKHEVILPKTMLILEGQQCNRLHILISGVLQTSHSKQVSKVRETLAERHKALAMRRTQQQRDSGADGEDRLTRQQTRKNRKTSPDKSSPAAAEEADFVPSATFAGARPGYSFKSGAQGTGYYRDATTSASSCGPAVAASKPKSGKHVSMSATCLHDDNGGGHASSSNSRNTRSSEGSNDRQSSMMNDRSSSASSHEWKKSLKATAIIEREGSMLGFPDPFVLAENSVYSVVARGKVEVLAFDRHELARSLCRCKEADTLAICRAIESEYNKLMARLKAKEHMSTSVTERTESDIKAEEYRRRMRTWMSDFNAPDHLNYLDQRVQHLEHQLEIACDDSKRLRKTLEAFIPAISQVIFNSPITKKHTGGRILTPRGMHVRLRKAGVGGAAAIHRNLHTNVAEMSPQDMAMPSAFQIDHQLLEAIREEQELEMDAEDSVSHVGHHHINAENDASLMGQLAQLLPGAKMEERGHETLVAELLEADREEEAARRGYQHAQQMSTQKERRGSVSKIAGYAAKMLQGNNARGRGGRMADLDEQNTAVVGGMMM